MINKPNVITVKGFYQVAGGSIIVVLEIPGQGVQMYDRQGLEYIIVAGGLHAEQLRPILFELKNLDYRYVDELSSFDLSNN